LLEVKDKPVLPAVFVSFCLAHGGFVCDNSAAGASK